MKRNIRAKVVLNVWDVKNNKYLIRIKSGYFKRKYNYVLGVVEFSVSLVLLRNWMILNFTSVKHIVNMRWKVTPLLKLKNIKSYLSNASSVYNLLMILFLMIFNINAKFVLHSCMKIVTLKLNKKSNFKTNYTVKYRKNAINKWVKKITNPHIVPYSN